MADAMGKVLSTSSPDFAPPRGSKHAVTVTYPKRGQEQFVTLSQDPPYDSPTGDAFTETYPKNGPKMSVGG